MPEAGEASTSGSGGPATKLVTPEELLEALTNVAEGSRTFTSQCLQQYFIMQKTFLTGLAGLASVKVEDIRLSQLDALLCTFLKNVYLLCSSLPGALRFDALESVAIRAVVAGANLACPFLGALHSDGSLEIGLPSNHQAKCDSVSELVRLATAAVLTYYHYTNFPAQEKFCAADDACLLFTSMAINSCADAQLCEALAAELSGVGAAISLAELRWLMHFLRGHLFGLFGQIAHITHNMEAQKEHLVSQQMDYLALLKVLPSNPAGYLHYTRSCLTFQQMRLADVFAAKGAVVAAQAQAQYYRAALACVRGVALALGASGDTFRPAELRKLKADACTWLDEEKAVLPEVYHDLLVVEPELTILRDKVLKGLPEASGGAGGDEAQQQEEVTVLDMLYATQPPREVPRGAVPAFRSGSKGEGESEAIAEGPEEEENTSA